MKKIRGFLIKHRVFSLFRCIRRKSQTSPAGYRRLNPSSRSISKLLKWGAGIKAKATAICSKNPGFRWGYLRVGRDPIVEADPISPPHAAVPKGKMAVYIGQNDGGFERVLVPVIYINHPLFGQLLRKAEAEYGHDHAGGITIPCRISEFENVKTRIAAGCGGRKMLPWKRSNMSYT
ncbi:auxin-responsive protein SAUR36 [Cynara cardunculus var. scolymus]|uniref:Auxin responsive SAUR protein n=1 Tax=Cynara cardunculus var. scolymus TaxID=59895 RepID=A0A103XEF0_CYNCS|nr:auxin-responsive protein SAUR36 [Cynara cardunculus var. scolymus]KVH89198.1 Auxin responsive SAUR protein [Cynara cardunculus var. scolymus]